MSVRSASGEPGSSDLLICSNGLLPSRSQEIGDWDPCYLDTSNHQRNSASNSKGLGRCVTVRARLAIHLDLMLLASASQGN